MEHKLYPKTVIDTCLHTVVEPMLWSNYHGPKVPVQAAKPCVAEQNLDSAIISRTISGMSWVTSRSVFPEVNEQQMWILKTNVAL